MKTAEQVIPLYEDIADIENELRIKSIKLGAIAGPIISFGYVGLVRYFSPGHGYGFIIKYVSPLIASVPFGAFFAHYYELFNTKPFYSPRQLAFVSKLEKARFQSSLFSSFRNLD